MRPTLVLACLLATTVGAPARAQDRTVILVRHAERAAEPRTDPPLTDAGRARAAALARALADASITAVIVTPYRRTGETAEPVAAAAQLVPIRVSPAGGLAAHAREVADSVLARPAGSTVLVVGHSNTVPAIIAALGGPRIPDLCENEYARLFQLVLPQQGTPRLTERAYGPPDPPGADACRAAARPDST